MGPIKKSRAAKNWCFQTVVLEKDPVSPLDCKEIKPVNLKRNQPWILYGRIDAEAEAPVFWPLMPIADSLEKSWCWERLKAEEGGDRGWDGWMTSLTQWTWTWQTLGGGEKQVKRDREAWCAATLGVAKRWTQLGDWTTVAATTNGETSGQSPVESQKWGEGGCPRGWEKIGRRGDFSEVWSFTKHQWSKVLHPSLHCSGSSTRHA